MMNRQDSFEVHSYNVYVNGCKLHNLEDQQTSCTYCNSRRFQVDNPVKPLATMKMMSLGDIVSLLLANPDTCAEELKYRHEYDNREKPEPNTIADFFDVEEYKAFKNKDFHRENDVAIALFIDGFVKTKCGGRLFTMIHVIGLSYNRQKRYKDKYVIQLCILPRKQKPASFASYLSVILAELHYLSTYCMEIKTPDNQIIRSKVHCLDFGCDALINHSTGLMKKGVRFLLSGLYITKVFLSFRELLITPLVGVAGFATPAGSMLIIAHIEMCFPDSNASLRTRQNYLDADRFPNCCSGWHI
ncbi:hypothetical protein [Parasitella parasitica]|uniref:Uncharacterized protein n=1 Tax=Parasitella parasitica TaxID=35722 RepID=A0A0B7NAU3_9FUNG|nr:hypothetical protein [Parasitella parasitica]